MGISKFKRFSNEFYVAFVTVILTSMFNYIIFSKQNKNDEKFRLNENLNKILELDLQYPFIEDSAFISRWNKNQYPNNDSSIMYQTYCDYVFNFVEDVCDHYKYDREDVENFIALNDLIKIHKGYWQAAGGRNSKEYPIKFREFIDKSYKKN